MTEVAKNTTAANASAQQQQQQQQSTKKMTSVSIDGRRLRGANNRKPFSELVARCTAPRGKRSVSTGCFYIISARFNGKKFYQIGSTHTPATVFDAKKRFVPTGSTTYEGVLMITNYGYLFDTLVRLYLLPNKSAEPWRADCEIDIDALLAVLANNASFQRCEAAAAPPMTNVTPFAHTYSVDKVDKALSLFCLTTARGQRRIALDEAKLQMTIGALLGRPEKKVVAAVAAVTAATNGHTPTASSSSTTVANGDDEDERASTPEPVFHCPERDSPELAADAATPPPPPSGALPIAEKKQ